MQRRLGQLHVGIRAKFGSYPLRGYVRKRTMKWTRTDPRRSGGPLDSNASAPYKPDSFWPLRSGIYLKGPMRIPVGAQRINGDSVANELVPLALATRMINLKVYGRDGSPGRLRDLAHAFAALAPVYTHSHDGSEVRRLIDEELISGFFRKNGAELHFMDGRSPILNIAVTNEAIDLVAEALIVPMDGEEWRPQTPPYISGS